MKQKITLSRKIKQNELISKKHQEVFNILHYTEHLLVLAYTVTGSVSIPAFTSLVDIPASIARSAVGIKIVR